VGLAEELGEEVVTDLRKRRHGDLPGTPWLENVVSRTFAPGFCRASATARCTATIVFPVPAEPDTRAAPA
jgi:hypothetical protein